MQEGYEDYSILESDNGCCLNCPSSYKGCLCTKCCCSKCFWYSSAYSLCSNHGRCDKVTKERLKKKYAEEEKEKSRKYNLLEEDNKKIEKEIREKKGIVSYYSCQRCGKEIVTEEEFIIVINKLPICKVCSGKIK